MDFERGINAAVKNLRRALNDSRDESQLYRNTATARVPAGLTGGVGGEIPPTAPSDVEGDRATAPTRSRSRCMERTRRVSNSRLPEKRGDAKPTSRKGSLIVLIALAIAAIGTGAFILILTLTADRRPQSGRLDGSTFIITRMRKERSFGVRAFLRDSGVITTSMPWAPWAEAMAKPHRLACGSETWMGKGAPTFFCSIKRTRARGSFSTALIVIRIKAKRGGDGPGKSAAGIGSYRATFRIENFGVLRGRPGNLLESSSQALIALVSPANSRPQFQW